MTNLPTTTVMSLLQAAEYLRISKAHLSNVINGKIPGIRPLRFSRVGRRILIRQEWIDEWLDLNEKAAHR